MPKRLVRPICLKTLHIWSFSLLLFALNTLLCAQVIQVGNGNTLHQGLPIEPLARFSYSQQLYYGTEIGQSGSISQLGFQYNVNSSGFLAANNNWRIWLGQSNLNSLSEWVDINNLTEVYQGNLQFDYFSGGLPGSGWLTIPFDSPFTYDSSQNLIIAVDENTDSFGHTSDDFYCFSTSNNRALLAVHNSLNPDPFEPPSPTPKSYLSNIRLHFSAAEEAPQNLYGYHAEGQNRLFWEYPYPTEVAAFRIHRNGIFLSEATTLSYADSEINAGYTYHYKVQARFADGNLSGFSNSIQITVPEAGENRLLDESFEAYPPFSTEMLPWRTLDLDDSLTWAWDFADFPHSGDKLSWLVFSPAQCTPPLTDITANGGSKMLASLACMQPPNNDWLISPSIHLGAKASLCFMARSYTAAYGLERLKVLISTTGTNPSDFSPLHAANYLQIPATWTAYTYDLSQYANSDIYLGFACVSLDALALFLDDIVLESQGGHLSASESLSPALHVINYPNPARGSFYLKSPEIFDAAIYNLKGQKVRQITAAKNFDSSEMKLSPGIYFIRITSDKESFTLKQVVLP